MTYKRPRGPRKMFIRVCANPKCPKPKRQFTAFRSTAKSCGDACRSKIWRKNNVDDKRDRILKKFGYACKECGEGWGRLFVRRYKGRVLVLCGQHNTALSNKMFRERVPGATKGYARRKFHKRLDAQVSE